MKKLFSLIHGEAIQIAPGSKIIPKEDFTELISSEELLTKVLKDKEVYLLEVAQEAEKIKEAAEQEGFKDGQKKWTELLVNLEEEIKKVHADLAKLVVPVALKAAKKIIGRELEISSEAIVDIVVNNLKAVAHHKKIKIYVNREDLAVMEKNKERLKGIFEQLEALSIIENEDVKPGGAIIETEGGIINAQLENLINTLEKAFESFMKEGEKKV